MTFCGKFFVSQYQKHRMGTFLCFRTFLLSESFLDKMGGGCITIFPQKFLLHIPGKKRTGIFECFTDFGYRKTFCIGGVSHDFLSKFYCLTLPKNFAREPFCVSNIFLYRKFMDKKDAVGGIS